MPRAAKRVDSLCNSDKRAHRHYLVDLANKGKSKDDPQRLNYRQWQQAIFRLRQRGVEF